MEENNQILKKDLIKQRDTLNAQIVAIDPNKVSFSVDANIINRLGKELIGRAETGVSELVKNAYDADANKVTLNFISSNMAGGSLVITDDGHGMTKEELIKGFMTLSSTAKIHEPLSPKYKRRRAGRKGIGRFATQFLGEKLTIITQTFESNKALKVVINWTDYEIDKELSSIENSIEIVEKENVQGTTLYIDKLRQSWTDAQIKRAFRYVSDLLQPQYLSKKSENLKIAKKSNDLDHPEKGEGYFLVNCLRTENGLETIIADIDKILFEKALAEIEGYIDEAKDGFYGVKSKSFGINEHSIPISADKKGGSEPKKFLFAKGVHFKVYYYIYDRIEYYSNGITNLELNNVEDLSQKRSGIRMYRNGFRVLPYGELGDDWLGFDRKRQKIDIELEEAMVEFNIPYTNKNFFGFVEVIDYEGSIFEETASREGLIENDALRELKDFIRKAVIAGIRRLSPFVYKEKQKRDERLKDGKTVREKLEGIQIKIHEFSSKKDDRSDNNQTKSDNEETKIQAEELKQLLSGLESDLKTILDELAMLRILATLGITIGEFTHEIIQFPVFFNSQLKSLLLSEKNEENKVSIQHVLEKVNHLDTYTKYFNDAVSRNAKRDLELIELRRVVRPFMESTRWDFEHEGIIVEEEMLEYDLFTCPMHPSEWHSILLNLYTNSKKALRRAKPIEKRIKITCGKNEKFVFVEFSDNGDGISKENENRIFDSFFTTSTPASIDGNEKEQLIGSGLGLKILKDIITEYKGDIYLTEPKDGYVTCFRIDIPAATDEQILNYEN